MDEIKWTLMCEKKGSKLMTKNGIDGQDEKVLIDFYLGHIQFFLADDFDH
jgi:hypothetical protein